MALSAAQLVILQNELTTDPLTRGYAAMTDAEAAVDLNTEYRTRDRTTMSSGEIMEHIDATEFAGLNTANRARVDRVLGLGADVIVGPGNAHTAVSEMIDAFGGGSVTLAALAAARAESISRAVELGLGTIGEGDVWDARNN